MILKSIITIHLLVLLINDSHSFILTNLFFDSTTNTAKDSNTENNLSNEINSELSKVKSPTLNCFGISNSLFANLVEKLFTQTTKAEDVRYYFYSRDQSHNVTVHAGIDFNLTNINYQSNRKTVLIIHGFMSSGREHWVQQMKDAFLKLDDVNVIVVDWQKGSNTWNYVSASISTKIVGAEVAKLLTEIKFKALEASPKMEEFGSLYFVGHSLGAHISGHASYVLKDLNKNQKRKFTIQRITGLDPAQPCFQTADLSLKLNKGDADYVDIIHTNAQNIMLLGLGLPNQLGDADYYPNGGKVQIGCKDIDTSFWNFLLLPVNIVKTAICSHGRSHALLTDSIYTRITDKCHFVGHQWDKKYNNITALMKEDCDEVTCPEMGINSIMYHPRKDGTYFVPTSSSSHYCDVSDKDRAAIEKQLKSDDKSIVGKLEEIL